MIIVTNKSDGQSIRLNIISEGSEQALEANGLFYELAYTHIFIVLDGPF